MSKSAFEKTEMDRSLGRLEEDNMDMQKTLQGLQSQLADAEQQHAQRYARNTKHQPMRREGAVKP